MSEKPIHYLSYDRFPAHKGAAVHIDAFVRALADEFGHLKLTTVAGNPPTPESNSVGRTEYCPRVWHRGIPISGKNLIERVASFRRAMLDDWEPTRIAHIRSIYEGYPLAKTKGDSCEKLVYEVNGLPSIELKYHYPLVADDEALLKKLRHQENVCLEAADLVLTVSQTNAEYLINQRNVPEERVRIIPNGVDQDVFSFKLAEQPSEEFRMLYVGTLASWQGLRVAIEALHLFLRDSPAYLTIIGDGRSSHRKQLAKLTEKLGVAKSVEILPPAPQQELVAHYHASHCAVAPLLSNDRNRVQGCCPLKVLEAMSCGTPLIASNMEVTRVLAEDGIEALLVRPGSAKAIKDAMFRLNNDRGLAIRLSAAARRRVKKHFTWSIAQRKLIDAYSTFLDISSSTNTDSESRSLLG